MDIETIIVLSMMVIIAIFSIYLVYKKRGSSTSSDELLERYLVEIIRIMQAAIKALKVDRNDYENEDDYKRALASYVANELRIMLEQTDISATLLKVLTVEVIAEFIFKSFDMISDITGYDRYIDSYNRAVKKKNIEVK